jgi:hypothetical protein
MRNDYDDDGGEYYGGEYGGNDGTLFLRSRPPFMERDMIVAPSWAVLDEREEEEELRRRRRRLSFPSDDVGYIGYLSDQEDAEDEDDVDYDFTDVIHRRRGQLLGPDISFTLSVLLFLLIGWLLWGGVREV